MRTRALLARVFVVFVALGLTGFAGFMTDEGGAWAAGQGGPEAHEYRGSIAIGIHPVGGTGPVCFTLTDPLGRRMSTGPPCEAAELDEIPGAYQDYERIDDDETGAPGPVTRVIFLNGPEPGEYSLSVNLPRDKGYDLEVQTVDTAGVVSHRLITGVPAAPDKTDEYVIVYPAPEDVLRKK